MLQIEVNLPIGSEDENKWMVMWGGDQVVFSLDTLKKAFEENPDEKDVYFNFNCDGGVVTEGFAIYDYIRTSGRNIHCNIEGKCHSMAIVMLLAAPLENRTAQKHAQSLIHCVRADIYGTLTAEEMATLAESLKKDEEKILDIYADRTGEDKDTLRTLMKEEQMRDTDFLIEHKFIQHVNAYTTNRHQGGGKHTTSLTPKNDKTMAKTMTEALQMAKDCLAKISNVLTSTATNYDHTDADGNVLFTTDVEDESLEVGMAATPDGTFEIGDGRTVVIADGVITEIREPETTEDEEVENLRNQVTELTNQVETLTAQLTEASNCITELQSTISSNYKPANNKRTTPARKPEERNQGETQAEHMNAMRKALGLKVKED